MAVFTDETALKTAMTENSGSAFVDSYILGADTTHFDLNKRRFVSDLINEEYGIQVEAQELVVVGSSKLGFGINEKRLFDGRIAPAYRPFSEFSDIDLSICSPALFNLLWHEISANFHQLSYFPYKCRKLGDYFTYGWLRLDQIPYDVAPRLVKCESLKVLRGKARKDRVNGHPKLNFGIFHDVHHLKLYQLRSVDACRKKLESPL
ncbi:hypothetical protein [Pseudotabrizicola formosa]|uniref:hypothetical protein n=1 Tax=Pseudotabrizicola formosa TaxID=2030009 RepID=UPI0011AEE4E0|nr:hypothetical protein [Pseudotabrizicola formosa]